MAVLGTQVIKSIQRGSTSIASTGGSTATTINAVDLDKSFVSASSANGYRGSRYSINSADPWVMSSTMGGAKLTSTTQITVVGGAGITSNNTYAATQASTCYWEVIEYV